MKKLHFFTDPGHGWLKAKTTDIIMLGLLDQISDCSYQKGDHLYLEEDCDASLYVNALKEKGLWNQDDLVFHRSDFKLSRIRSYPRFMENSRFK